MSCCYECEQSGLGCESSQYQLLGGLLERPLMGAIPQQMPPITGGGSFQFGYNIGYLAGKPNKPDEVAKVLEDLSLSYDTHSYHVAGTLNPYFTIEGYAVTHWESGSDFGEAIYQAVRDAGYPIDYSSIQFRFEPYYPSGYTPPTMVGTPRPGETQTDQQNQKPPAKPDECKWSDMDFGDWVACQLGIKDAVGGVKAGATGAIVGVGVLTIAAVVLLKR